MSTQPSSLPLLEIAKVILNENSSSQSLHQALDSFGSLCSQITGIIPDQTFSAWAEDSFLENGVAINPQAAAHCITDYQRSIVFIRGVYAALIHIQKTSDNTAIKILYAGCGPFATLLLPILGMFHTDDLEVYLLDIHQKSLDSVRKLLTHFGLNQYRITLLQNDACTYRHPNNLHLIIAETMQKSLEQEPQFAVTANLGPQLHEHGIFIPQNIEVQLCLASLEYERDIVSHYQQIDHKALVKKGKRHPLGTVLNLKPSLAAAQLKNAHYNPLTEKFELEPVKVSIPKIKELNTFDALFLTHITVFKHYQLDDYESEITLPLKCQTLTDLKAEAKHLISYQLGNYPRFNVDEGINN